MGTPVRRSVTSNWGLKLEPGSGGKEQLEEQVGTSRAGRCPFIPLPCTPSPIHCRECLGRE